jgi:hypothetical protein
MLLNYWRWLVILIKSHLPELVKCCITALSNIIKNKYIHLINHQLIQHQRSPESTHQQIHKQIKLNPLIILNQKTINSTIANNKNKQTINIKQNL